MCEVNNCEADLNSRKCRYTKTRLGEEQQACWNETACQRACDHERYENGSLGPGCADSDGSRCHEQCLSGCKKPNDPSQCYSCRNIAHNVRTFKVPPNELTTLGRLCDFLPETFVLVVGPKMRDSRFLHKVNIYIL